MGEFATAALNSDEPVEQCRAMIRPILNYSNHPQAMKRLACGLCLQEMIGEIGTNQEVVGRFLLEIFHSVMVLSRSSKPDKESIEINEVSGLLVRELLVVLSRNIEVLVIENMQRAYHSDIYEFSE